MKIPYRLSLLAVALAASITAQAQIAIDTWTVTSDRVTFSITGDFGPTGFTPIVDANSVYIGAPGSKGWFLGGSINGYVGAQINGNNAIAGIHGGPSSDFILLGGFGPDFDLVNGGSIHLVGSFVGADGAFDASKVNAADVIVSWGGPTSFSGPDTSFQIGLNAPPASAVPEPSTYASILGLAVIGLAATRRRARSAKIITSQA